MSIEQRLADEIISCVEQMTDLDLLRDALDFEKQHEARMDVLTALRWRIGELEEKYNE